MANELPISANQARRATEWLMTNFGPTITQAVGSTAFKKKHLCAIACQETAFVWVGWIRTRSVQEIVERCVFDASGDASGTSRSAFPRNTAAFRERFGAALTNMLISEANLTRAMRGFGSKTWVYKGYGIFQYDLQHIDPDEEFFREKHWYDFRTCIKKAMTELKAKHAQTGDLWQAIKRYNGSGARAEQYMRNVKAFTPICGEITGD